MRSITFTKKQIKRAAAIAVFIIAAAAVIITLITTSVGTKAADKLLPIYSVKRPDKKVAVTFDVAWENSNTDELIKILSDADAKATFFITGDWCDRYPDDVRKFHEAGHDIENHSDKHPHILGANVNDLISDTRECSRKIKMLTGEEPTLYRAPYGEYDDSLITTLGGMGLTAVQWDVDSVDWKEPPAADIKKKILKGVKPGSILLFHNDLANTTEALPDILANLKSQGYQFVTVKELIYADKYTIDANGQQIPNGAGVETVKLTDAQIAAVMEQYGDQLAALGYTKEQLAEAAQALKQGDLSKLPEELRIFAQEVLANQTGVAVSAPTSAPTSAPPAASDEK